jgi:hypothetical protein
MVYYREQYFYTRILTFFVIIIAALIFNTQMVPRQITYEVIPQLPPKIISVPIFGYSVRSNTETIFFKHVPEFLFIIT